MERTRDDVIEAAAAGGVPARAEQPARETSGARAGPHHRDAAPQPRSARRRRAEAGIAVAPRLSGTPLVLSLLLHAALVSVWTGALPPVGATDRAEPARAAGRVTTIAVRASHAAPRLAREAGSVPTVEAPPPPPDAAEPPSSLDLALAPPAAWLAPDEVVWPRFDAVAFLAPARPRREPPRLARVCADADAPVAPPPAGPGRVPSEPAPGSAPVDGDARDAPPSETETGVAGAATEPEVAGVDPDAVGADAPETAGAAAPPDVAARQDEPAAASDGVGAAGGDPSASARALAGQPPPRYPRWARDRGQEGLVVLAVDVDVGGRAVAVAVTRSSGFTVLDEAARAAVRRWRFEPARAAGVPVASRTDVTIRFELTGRG